MFVMRCLGIDALVRVMGMVAELDHPLREAALGREEEGPRRRAAAPEPQYRTAAK